MPKNVKRRVAEMPTDDERQQSTKRQRTNYSSSRRYSKTEDEFQQKRCLLWFKRYSTPNEPEMIGPDGIESFCDEISVAPENVAMLVLAYKMGARQMGFLSQTEWLKGLTDLQCDTIPKLQTKIEYLQNMLNDPSHFKSIYRYAYDFARDKDQRSMDVDTAKGMLELLLGKPWPLFADFVRFIDQSKYKVINKDQWSNVLEFSRTISPDLRNYDVDGAWPVLLDEFVEWMRNNRAASASGSSSQAADSTS